MSAYAAPKGETDTQRLAREASELSNAQIEQSKAFNQYYEKMKSGDEDPKALAAKMIGPSSEKIANILSDRRQANYKMIFGRTFLPDGSNVDTAEFKKNPEKYLSILDKQPTLPTQIPNSLGGSGGSSSNGGRVGGKYSSARIKSPSGPAEPEVVLDGSKLPKEIEFPALPRQPATKRGVLKKP